MFLSIYKMVANGLGLSAGGHLKEISLPPTQAFHKITKFQFNTNCPLAFSLC